MTMGPGAEVHVAGLVVHAYPEALAGVEQYLRTEPGAHVHASTPDGKLVVTLEATHADAIADALCRIQTFDGVLAAALVYQHSEPAAAMDDEVEL
jgi:nitrate reductase NapD